MANSALFSTKSSTFEQSGTANTARVFVPDIGLDLSIIPVVVKDGLVKTQTFTVLSDVEPTGEILYSLNGGAYQAAVSTRSGTENTFQLTVPIGTHTLAVKLSENDSESPTVNVIASRFVILGTGQSNMMGIGSQSETLITSASGHNAWLLRTSDVINEMVNYWDSSTGQTDSVSNDGNSPKAAWMARYANLLLSTYDEPVICIPAPLGGSTMDQWIPNSTYSSGGQTLYSNAVRRANLYGGVTLVMHQQGENDAVDSKGTTSAGFQDGLNSIVDGFYTDLDAPTLIIPLHNITRDNYNGTTGASLDDSGQEAIRAAQIAVAASNPNAYIAAPTKWIDLSDGDNIHFKLDDELNAVRDIVGHWTEQYLGEVSRSVSFSGGGVAHGDTVNLSLSTDISPDTYVTWAQVNNGAPTVVINSYDSASASYVAPSEDADIQIAAYVSDGQYGAYDVQTFAVSASANNPPTANAGIDQSVAAGVTVQLDGTGSTDGDGTIVSYAWAQTAGDAVMLTGASTSTPSFTSPSTNAQQTLTFELTVTDNEAATDTDTVDVVVAAEVVQPIESTLNLTITGISAGSQALKLWSETDNTLVYNSAVTFAGESASITLPVAAGTVVTGRWLGTNPPTTGTGIYGVTV